jgi:hypothetical protein
MRQQSTNVYSELVCVIPGQGLTTLYRGTTYAQALAYRSNNALRNFRGHKVSAVERRSEQHQPTGWLFKEPDAKQGVSRLW